MELEQVNALTCSQVSGKALAFKMEEQRFILHLQWQKELDQPQ
jgi:hypothetical protein